MIVPGQQGQGHGADESRFDALDRRVLGQRRYEEIELAARYLERKVGGGPAFRRYFYTHSIPTDTLHRRRKTQLGRPRSPPPNGRPSGRKRWVQTCKD